jgi:hypothetical protein
MFPYFSLLLNPNVLSKISVALLRTHAGHDQGTLKAVCVMILVTLMQPRFIVDDYTDSPDISDSFVFRLSFSYFSLFSLILAID